MERLTENKIGVSYPLKDKAASKVGLFTDYDGFYAHFEAINRLGEIEDILGEEYDLDYLKKLIQADKDGQILIIEDAELSDETTLNFVNYLLEDLKSGKTE